MARMGKFTGSLAAATVLAAAACTPHKPPPAAPPTAATSATSPGQSATVQPGPHSLLANIRLPAGAVFDGNSSLEERWHYKTPYDATVAFLSGQFATGPKYDSNGATSWANLPPCYNGEHQSPPKGWVSPDTTRWLWTDGSTSLSVQIFRPNSRTSYPGEIVIDHQRWDNSSVCNHS
jgi:hypothetical protein